MNDFCYWWLWSFVWLISIDWLFNLVASLAYFLGFVLNIDCSCFKFDCSFHIQDPSFFWYCFEILLIKKIELQSTISKWRATKFWTIYTSSGRIRPFLRTGNQTSTTWIQSTSNLIIVWLKHQQEIRQSWNRSTSTSHRQLFGRFCFHLPSCLFGTAFEQPQSVLYPRQTAGALPGSSRYSTVL